ncbi:MAG TPA: DUF6489 family protein [Roseomonas sp.]|jgi:hypothetical protein
MKMTIEIDCTPEEARRALGLPDLTPLHAAMLDRLQAQMPDLAQATPEAWLAAWTRMAQPGWMGDAMNSFFKAAAGPTSKPKRGDTP